jgi:hypothetical protein
MLREFDPATGRVERCRWRPERTAFAGCAGSLDGFSLLRTDRNGWIDVTTDGVEMRVAVERGE